MLKRYIILCFLIFSLILMAGCKNMNPLKTPDQFRTEKNEKIHEKLDKDESISEERGSAFSEKFQSKSEQIYYKAVDELIANNQSNDEKMPLSKLLLYYFYDIYYTMRQYAAWICVVSIAFGSLGFAFARYNKGARRVFLFGFIIIIPIVVLVIVYGVGISNSVYLYD